MFKRCFEKSTLIILILFFMVSSAFAFTNSINYQGKLTDSSGDLLHGEYLLTFKIYGVETWGTPLWTEEQLVMVDNGIYNAELGAVNPFPTNLFEREKLYLEVIIFNTDTSLDETLSPRIPFNATGFSMKAKKADSVAWSNITGKPAGFADNTDNVNDADASLTNELQTLGTSGNTITLSKKGGSVTVPYATYANNADMVDGKHASQLINDADADPSNEIQTLGKSGNNIILSKGGGSVTVPYATNANMVDGKHASQFGDGHSLDAVDGSPVNAVYVNNVGNLGIGTTNPGQKLDVRGKIRIGDYKGNWDLWGGYDLNFQCNEVTKVRINNNGNVGIGTVCPSYKLHVIGDIAYTGNIYDVSDIRLKENIIPIENALEKVSSIRGIYFNYKEESQDSREVGVIAQEVEEVLPEIVSEDSDGYKSVDYSKLTPLLIEATKALKSENETLREEIEKIKEAVGL